MTRLLQAIALVSLLSIQCFAADWYVDIDNDGGTEDGTSWATAWGKWADIVWASVGSGDTVWVRGGSYNESMGGLNGEVVDIKIDPNETSQAVFNDMNIYNCDGCSLDGYISSTYPQMFKVTGHNASIDHGVNIRQTLTFTLKGVEVDRSGEYTSDTGQQHGIRLSDGVGDITIEYCLIENTTGDGINISGGNYTGMSGEPYDWFVINECTIQNYGDDGVAFAITNGTLKNSVVDKNDFDTYFGGHPDGIQLQNGNLDDSNNYAIYNNTIKGNNQNVFVEYIKGPFLVYNNILIGSGQVGTHNCACTLSRGLNVSAHGTYSGTSVFANNVLYNFIDFSSMNGGFPAGTLVRNNVFVNCKTIASSETMEGFITNSNMWHDISGVQFYDSDGNPVSPPADRREGSAVSDDPEFDNYTTSGFNPTPSSPTRDNANAWDGSSYYTTDKNGNTRPQGAGWDIGAYEFVGPTLQGISLSQLINLAMLTD